MLFAQGFHQTAIETAAKDQAGHVEGDVIGMVAGRGDLGEIQMNLGGRPFDMGGADEAVFRSGVGGGWQRRTFGQGIGKLHADALCLLQREITDQQDNGVARAVSLVVKVP